MAGWQIDNLYDALTTAGWTILRDLPGDDREIAAIWEIQRNTQYDPLHVEFLLGDDARGTIENATISRIQEFTDITLEFSGPMRRWELGVTYFVSRLDFCTSPFELVYTLGEHGWAQATVSAAGKHHEMTISYLTENPLGNLANAVSTLLRSADIAAMKTSWADEPGDHLWVIRRKGSEVSISILWFKDWYHADDIRAGKKVFTASCQLAHLGRVVLRELSRLKDLVGVEAYAQRWGRPFPAEEMTDLAEAIAA